MATSNSRTMAKIIAQAWADPEYKKKLLANPGKVARKDGLKVPKGAKVHIHENSKKEVHLVLPQKPEGLADDELNRRAGGAGYHVMYTCSC